MKSTISLITAISFTALVGCNTNNQSETAEKDQDPYTVVDDGTDEQALSDLDTRNDMSVTSGNAESTIATENSKAGEGNFTEAEMTEEVVVIDTIATNITYDVNRRTIEEVDTIGATKTYEVRRRIVKRKILVDTVTETTSEEQQVKFEEGDYEVLSEEITKDTVTERIEGNGKSSSALKAQTSKQSSNKNQAEETSAQNAIQSNSVKVDNQPNQTQTERPSSEDNKPMRNQEEQSSQESETEDQANNQAPEQAPNPNTATEKQSNTESNSDTGTTVSNPSSESEPEESTTPGEETKRNTPTYQPAQSDTTKTTKKGSNS